MDGLEQMSLQTVLSAIGRELESCKGEGKVADYIPELGNVDPDKFGIHLTTLTSEHFAYGDTEEKFSIQSISKVFALALVFEREGERLWRRVGVEPSGNPFNSLAQLEYEAGIPRNPFINAGALVICDHLISHCSMPKQTMMGFFRTLAGSPLISFNQRVYESEKAHGYRNRALINLMKSYNNITNDLEQVLDLYFFICSVEMTCRELAQAASFLANGGVNPLTGQQIVSSSKAKRINTIMQLCGFYDEAGEFSFKVGLPGKSGVGGGIIAVHPGKYSIAAWSPRLNAKGNSCLAMKALELFTTKTKMSIF